MHPSQGVRLNPAWPRHGPHSSANLILPITAASFLRNCKSDLSTAKIDSVLGKTKVIQYTQKCTPIRPPLKPKGTKRPRYAKEVCVKACNNKSGGEEVILQTRTTTRTSKTPILAIQSDRAQSPSFRLRAIASIGDCGYSVMIRQPAKTVPSVCRRRGRR